MHSVGPAAAVAAVAVVEYIDFDWSGKSGLVPAGLEQAAAVADGGAAADGCEILVEAHAQPADSATAVVAVQGEEQGLNTGLQDNCSSSLVLVPVLLVPMALVGCNYGPPELYWTVLGHVPAWNPACSSIHVCEPGKEQLQPRNSRHSEYGSVHCPTFPDGWEGTWHLILDCVGLLLGPLLVNTHAGQCKWNWSKGFQTVRLKHQAAPTTNFLSHGPVALLILQREVSFSP